MLKKFLSCLLIMAMVWAMLPVNAVQPKADLVRKQAVIPMETASMINPLYADELTEEDCLQSLEAPILGADAGSEEEYAYTYEEAAKQLREGMKQRKETVQVYYCTENYNFSTDAPAIWEESLTHTGVPTEGDYLKWVWSGCKYGGGGYISDNVYYVTFTFTLSYHTTAKQEKELDEAVENLLSELNPTGTDYQKLKTVYDYICANITYDYDSQDKLKHTAYAALINKTAVCQGYSTLLYRLALEMGIDIRLISGIGNGGGHGWNIVELNDVYYNMDSTWDAIWMQQLGYYDYFLRCEDTFTEGGTDHIRDEEYNTAQFHTDYPMSQTDFNPETDDVPDNIVASGTCGENLSWALDKDGTLTISGTGAMDNYDSVNNVPWYSYRESITDVVIESGVTSIANYAFYYCNNLTGVTIPASVTSIGLSAFLGCTSLTGLTLPGSVTSIGRSAFNGCSSLTDLTISGSVTSIGSSAFSGCSSLSTVTISDGVTAIGDAAFFDCSSLTDLTIPGSVTSIGRSAFAECSGLSKITFLGDAPTFDSGVFYSVTVTAHYPADNDTWTDDVMQSYGGTVIWMTDKGNIVASGTCGESVRWALDKNGTLTIAGTGAMKSFAYNKRAPWSSFSESITDVVINDGVATIGGYAFYECSNMTRVTIPDSVTSIGNSAFFKCTSLTGVTIPDSVTTIDIQAFYSCTNMTGVTIGDSVTTIGQSAFFWCRELRDVTIPDSVTSIDERAFALCTSLAAITFLGDAPTFGSSVFSNVTAIAYYSADNDTWTDEVMQNYGGTITWVAYTKCDHTSTSVINAKEATCTEAGYTGDTYCNDCRETIAYGTEIEMKDHTPVTDAAVAATCTTAGKTEGSHCADCNTVIVAQTVIPAKGHTGGSVCTECGEVKYIAGDMDRDGALTVADILSLKNLLLSGELSDEELDLADLNKDGKLNVVDIILAKNMILSQ